jgi:hypothetical protein
MGYTTYIVNQTGQDIMVWWNTGENGAGWTDHHLVQAGQNVGFNRGGLCLSQVGFGPPNGDGNNIYAHWPDGFIDGCLSWGFVVGLGSNGNMVITDAEAWAEGQPGLMAKYPPTHVLFSLRNAG